MKRQEIEIMALDIISGELSAEEAAKLFRIYLADHPEAKAWAEEIQHLYRASQRTIKQKSLAVVGNTSTWPKAKQTFLFGTHLSWAKWAALFIFGIAIGYSLAHREGIGKEDRVPFSKARSTQVKAGSFLNSSPSYTGEFWGEKILAASSSSRPAQSFHHKEENGFWSHIEPFYHGRSHHASP